MYIDFHGYIAVWLTMMEGQHSLTQIFKMGQRPYQFLLCQWRKPILGLWLFATCRPPDYPKYTHNNRWYSIDDHFQDGVWMVSQSVLPIKESINSYMTVSNLSAVWLPTMHDQTLWRHRWYSFSKYGRQCVAIVFANTGSQYFDYV